MFGSTVLETAVGLMFVFLLVSMLVTIANEMLAALLSSRARCLGRGLARLIGKEWMEKVYAHPLISGAAGKEQPSVFNRGPAYIPSRSFANVLISIVQHETTALATSRQALRAALDAATHAGATLATLQQQLQGAAAILLSKDGLERTVGGDLQRHLAAPSATHADLQALIDTFIDTMPARYLRQTLEAFPGGDLRTTLLTLFDDAHNDLGKMKENIEVWFNSGMDRVNGWYKRRTQVVIAILSLGMAVAMNVDTVQVFRHLQTYSGARDVLVAQAAQFAQQGTAPADGQPVQFATVQKNLKALGLPIGWVEQGGQGGPADPGSGQVWPRSRAELGPLLLQHGLGWILTALAASLGAPFWFDMLNRVVSIRATGKPPGEEPKPPNVVSVPVEPGQSPREADRLRHAEPPGR